MTLNIYPCIFCESTKVEIDLYKIDLLGDDNEYQIICKSCGASGPIKDSKSMATYNWNRISKTSIEWRRRKSIESDELSTCFEEEAGRRSNE